MADGAASPSRLRHETEVRSHLPYARHVNDHIVALDSGALMMVFQVAGASFETADVRDLNDWHVKLNQAWRNLADDRLAVSRPIFPPHSDAWVSSESATSPIALAHRFSCVSARSWGDGLTRPTAGRPSL